MHRDSILKDEFILETESGLTVKFIDNGDHYAVYLLDHTGLYNFAGQCFSDKLTPMGLWNDFRVEQIMNDIAWKEAHESQTEKT